MARRTESDLSRRERQIMDIVYRLEKASAAEVRENLPDPPSYSAVRAMLRILEEKGQLRHTKDGAKYIYRATRPRSRAGISALRRVLDTFFHGSAESAVAALLENSDADLSEEELDRLSRLIDEARKEGGG